MRESWTDERLDEFATRVDLRFDRVEERIVRIDERFSQVEAAITRLDVTVDRLDKDFREFRIETSSRFDQIQTRLDSMQRTMIVTFAGLATSLIVVLATAAH